MAKPVVKKKKASSDVDAQVKLFKEASERRFEIANEAYAAQDQKTKAVLDAMVSQLMIGASGTISVRSGTTSVPVEVGIDYVEYNALYVATEILKHLAMMDIRVANYKFPTVYCAECTEKIIRPKKKKGNK